MPKGESRTTRWRSVFSSMTTLRTFTDWTLSFQLKKEHQTSDKYQAILSLAPGSQQRQDLKILWSTYFLNVGLGLFFGQICARFHHINSIKKWAQTMSDRSQWCILKDNPSPHAFLTRWTKIWSFQESVATTLSGFRAVLSRLSRYPDFIKRIHIYQ